MFSLFSAHLSNFWFEPLEHVLCFQLSNPIHFQNRRAVNKDPVGFELRLPVDFPNPFDEDEDDDEIVDDFPLKPPRLFKSSPIL